MISSLIKYFSRNLKNIVISQPAISLFEYHCNINNIKYHPWMLNTELQFELGNLPPLTKSSVVILSSPNNPVGCSISQRDLEFLLSNYTQTLFLIDEIYFEFNATCLEKLVKTYPNLLLLRSFSKSFSNAGIRLGYLICQRELAVEIKKLISQFSLNQLTLCFAKELLSDPEAILQVKYNIKSIVKERKRIFTNLVELSEKGIFNVNKSGGNFLLVQFSSEEYMAFCIVQFQNNGLTMLNVSKMPLLKNSIRIAIGNNHENDQLINIFHEMNKRFAKSLLITTVK